MGVRARAWIVSLSAMVSLTVNPVRAFERPVDHAGSIREVGWKWLASSSDAKIGVSQGHDLWLARPEGSVEILRLDGAHGPCKSGAPILPPGGHRIHAVACGLDGRIWALASRRERSYDRLFVGDPEGQRWLAVSVPTLGTLLALDVDPDGIVWVGGQRRDVFRVEDGVAIREITPLPYHNHNVRMVGDGVGWILAATLGRWALYRRSPGDGWRVIARGDGGDHVGIARADRESAWITTLRGVVRFDHERPDEPTELNTLAHDPGRLIHLDEDGTGWLIRDGRPRRIVDGQLETGGPMVEFAPRAIVGTIDGRPVLVDDEDRLWQLSEEATSPELPGFRRLVLVDGALSIERGVGAAVIGSGSEAWVYLIDHEYPNPTVRAGDIWKSETLRGWKTLSTALRNGDVGRSPERWNFTYDLAAVVADLNGDGFEDLVLSTLYDGLKLYRNVRGDHFVNYSDASGLGGHGGNLDHAACLLDADMDGDLDLYVSRFLGPDALFRNNGSAVFDDVTGPAGLATVDSSTTPACVDLDDDGDTDVVVPTWGRGLLLHENLGSDGHAPRFRTHTWFPKAETAENPRGLTAANYNAVAAADLDGDGLPELFVTRQPGRDVLLRNRGAFAFVSDPETLPPDDPGVVSLGATFLDHDHDGDLDLIVTGLGGARLYRNEDGRFRWTPPPDWPERVESLRPENSGLAVVDGDDDGDLDFVVNGEDGATRFYRSVTDDDRWIRVAIVGPPWNRSAVGAIVSLRSVGLVATRADVQRRTIPGSSGYGSHDSKTVHFGGVTPGQMYRIEARLEGRRGVATMTEVVAPAHVTIHLSERRSAGAVVADWSYRLRVFPGDPWNRLWIVLSLVAGALTTILAVLVCRYRRPAVAAAVITIAQLLAAIVLRAGLPLDPGPVQIAGSVVPSVFLAGLGLLALRIGVAPRAVPELLVELDVALRTFRHNRTPRRALERLRFVSRNLADADGEIKGARLHLLREDVVRYRDVVRPELGSIVRLTRALDLDQDVGPRLVKRQDSCLEDLLRWTVSDGPSSRSKLIRARLGELSATLDELEAWIGRLRDEVANRLSVDLGDALRGYVASRAGIMAGSIELHDRVPRPLRVRFLDSDLHRTLDTMVENSVYAMRGRASGRIRLETEWTGGRRVAIRIRDDGPGIPEGINDRVFEPGYSTRGRGHGYGLDYVRRVVTRFGGIVAVEPSATGACIRIELDVVHPFSPPRSDLGEDSAHPAR